METYCSTAGVLSLGLQPLQPQSPQSPQVLWKKGICTLNVHILIVHGYEINVVVILVGNWGPSLYLCIVALHFWPRNDIKMEPYHTLVFTVWSEPE